MVTTYTNYANDRRYEEMRWEQLRSQQQQYQAQTTYTTATVDYPTIATNNYLTQDITVDGYCWTSANIDRTYSSNTLKMIENIDIELKVGRYDLAIDAEHISSKITSRDRKINNGFSMIVNAFDDVTKTAAKAIFLEALKKSANEHGRKLAQDIVNKKLHVGTETQSQMKDRLLNDIQIKIPNKEGDVYVSLNQILKTDISEGEMLSFDFDKVRQIIVQNKKKLYVEKVKTINIIRKIDDIKVAKLKDCYAFWGINSKQDFKRLNEQEVDKELRALQLLRKLVKEDQFKSYIEKSFIDIPDFKENKIYRIHKNKRIEIIDSKTNKIDKRLCIELTDRKCPPTDSVIAKYLITSTDKKKLIANSNVYDEPRSVVDRANQVVTANFLEGEMLLTTPPYRFNHVTV